MIIIPRRLREMVEGYIGKQDRSRECGGWFFGSGSKFQAFLPCPNYSKQPWREFNRGGSGSDLYAQLYGDLIGLKVVAEMHTHPNGAVVSEGDLAYLRGHDLRFEVVIADMKERFRWFVIDRQCQEVGIIESDEQLVQAAFILAQEVGLTELGRAFLSPQGQLLATNKLGRAFLVLNEDAVKLYRYPLWGKWGFTLKQASRDLGISVARIKKAKAKLETVLG